MSFCVSGKKWILRHSWSFQKETEQDSLFLSLPHGTRQDEGCCGAQLSLCWRRVHSPGNAKQVVRQEQGTVRWLGLFRRWQRLQRGRRGALLGRAQGKSCCWVGHGLYPGHNVTRCANWAGSGAEKEKRIRPEKGTERIQEMPFRPSFSLDGGRQKNVVVKMRNYHRSRAGPWCTR